jgi:hypothetical protein
LKGKAMKVAKERVLFAFAIIVVLVGCNSAMFAQSCTATTPN